MKEIDERIVGLLGLIVMLVILFSAASCDTAQQTQRHLQRMEELQVERMKVELEIRRLELTAPQSGEKQ